MKKTVLLFCLFWVAFCGRVLAQEGVSADSAAKLNAYRSSVYVEFLGNGMLGSLNYERLFKLEGTQTLALRAGGLFIPTGRVEDKLEYEMFIPVEVTVFGGEKDVKFEAGFGLTFYGSSASRSGDYGSTYSFTRHEVFPVIRLGFRWYPLIKPDFNPVFVRIGFTPLFFNYDDFLPPVIPWVGVSLGYSFGLR